MTEERERKLTFAAQEESRARADYERLGMRNTAGLTPLQRESLDIDYAHARARWLTSLEVLRRAVGSSHSQGDKSD
jgi:hypothetical protein